MDEPEIREDELDEIELKLGTMDARTMEALESIAKSLEALASCVEERIGQHTELEVDEQGNLTPAKTTTKTYRFLRICATDPIFTR